MKWTNEGHEFDKLAEKVCEEGYGYYIWGAGITGKLIYKKIKNYVLIQGFIDRNEEMRKQNIDGLPIMAPEEIESSATNVRYLISPAFYEEIKDELKQMNLEENKDFFNSLVFAQIYLVYKHQEVMIYRTDISITEKCTLKCKKCNMFMPHFANPQNRDIALLKEDVDAYFAKVDYVYEFKVLGGEPFLYPDLQEFLVYLTENYSHKVEQVEIFTNATIRLSDELLQTIKEKNIYVGITNYTSVVPYEKRLDEFRADLERYQIPYKCVQADIWQDFGFPDAPYDLEGEENLIRHFDACHFVGRGLYNKRMYFCHMFTSAVRCGLFRDSEEDSIDMTSDIDKKKIIEFDMGYCKKGYHDFCKVCRGCRSTILVPAGEQKE